MREIKFRGKQVAYHRPWIYGSLLMLDGKAYILDEEDTSVSINPSIDPESGTTYVEGLVEVDPSTIGQYTGLKDKNGTEIYEGDILSENGNIIGVVVWSARYGVSIRKKNTTWALINFCLDSDFGCGTLSNIKVIGNIHDNPELLEEGGER